LRFPGLLIRTEVVQFHVDTESFIAPEDASDAGPDLGIADYELAGADTRSGTLSISSAKIKVLVESVSGRAGAP
jgi:hypothetical protein